LKEEQKSHFIIYAGFLPTLLWHRPPHFVLRDPQFYC